MQSKKKNYYMQKADIERRRRGNKDILQLTDWAVFFLFFLILHCFVSYHQISLLLVLRVSVSVFMRVWVTSATVGPWGTQVAAQTAPRQRRWAATGFHNSAASRRSWQGACASVQHTPLFPPHCTARSASRWRGSSTAPDHGQLAPRCKPRHQPQPWRRLVRTGS